jgi:hypothetical protein
LALPLPLSSTSLVSPTSPGDWSHASWRRGGLSVYSKVPHHSSSPSTTSKHGEHAERQ